MRGFRGGRPHGARILLVESSLRDNGGLRVSTEHARRWHATGSPTRLAVIQDVDERALLRPHPSLPVEMLSPRGGRFRTTAVPALARLVRLAARSDVVVSGSEVGNGLVLGYVAARLTRRPFAVLVQADVDDALRAWVPASLHGLTRRILAHADAAVCVAESLVPGVVAWGLPRHRVHVVVNGIDVAAIRDRAGLPPLPAEGRVAVGRDERTGADGVPTVVANGRLSAAKDFPLLVRAHARVRRAGVDHRLLIMGEGHDRPLIEAAVAELDVQDSVSLPGYVPNPYPELAQADLFVLSSRTEGLPLTLLEALAVGAPVVSTCCGTGPDVVLEDGRYGDLVPVGDEEALAAAIERHLREPALLRQRARHGPRRALDFDAAPAAAAVQAVLEGLAARSKGHSAPESGNDSPRVAGIDGGQDVRRQREP